MNCLQTTLQTQVQEWTGQKHKFAKARQSVASLFAKDTNTWRRAKRESATRLAQLGERRSAERKAVGSNPGWTNTQGL